MGTCLLAPSSFGCYGKEQALSLIRCTPGTRYEGGVLSCGTEVRLGGGMRVRLFFYSSEPSEPHIPFKYTDLLEFAFVYKIKIKIFLFLRRILLLLRNVVLFLPTGSSQMITFLFFSKSLVFPGIISQIRSCTGKGKELLSLCIPFMSVCFAAFYKFQYMLKA